MSKRKKNRVKTKLSYQEILLINLQKVFTGKDTNADDKQKARSLIKWFQANRYFTPAQTALAKSLTYIKKEKPAKLKKYYLYAISNGKEVKLGMSSDIKKRLASMQTASPSKLVLLWEYYIANSPANAMKIERRLHKACKPHHIRGEWFRMECLDTVNSFNPNKKHTAKWEYAKLVTVDTRRKAGNLNFTVEDVRRTDLTGNLNRVWEQKEDKELYQLEIKKLLDDDHVVLVRHERF